MNIELMVAEIGSTTTIVNGFSGLKSGEPRFLGRGLSPTTVLIGDVTAGLKNAIEDLRLNLNAGSISWDDFYATSSAAGGLRMTVHGLVYDMTVRAAREAALGAGAVIKYVTAGKLRKLDVQKIYDINPNLILLAGGVDFGERDTALYNAEIIQSMDIKAPVIYAGNIENIEEIKSIFAGSGRRLYIAENVYPKVDVLNTGPTRKIIQSAFEENITNAPGMKKVRDMVNGSIIPTPGAIMEAASCLYDEIGDLIVIDVGGATTDIHSVTAGSEEIQRISISPEPLLKRTVEGDLGVFLNIPNLIEIMDIEKLKAEFGDDAVKFIASPKPIPETEAEKKIVEALTLKAIGTALSRHAGHIRYIYGASGKRRISEGRDLSNVKYAIGTGGALTMLPDGREIIERSIKSRKDEQLYPKDVNILIDHDYIMASTGVMMKGYRDAALQLLKSSLGLLKVRG